MSTKAIDPNKVFLVVWHVEGDEPDSSIVVSESADEAWEKVAGDYTFNVMTDPDEEDKEIYLDHVKSFTELSEQSALLLTAANK